MSGQALNVTFTLAQALSARDKCIQEEKDGDVRCVHVTGKGGYCKSKARKAKYFCSAHKKYEPAELEQQAQAQRAAAAGPAGLDYKSIKFCGTIKFSSKSEVPTACLKPVSNIKGEARPICKNCRSHGKEKNNAGELTHSFTILWGQLPQEAKNQLLGTANGPLRAAPEGERPRIVLFQHDMPFLAVVLANIRAGIAPAGPAPVVAPRAEEDESEDEGAASDDDSEDEQ